MSFDITARRDSLRHRRVELRRAIERQAQLIQWRSGDAIDNRLRLENLQRELRGTEHEYRELEALLGQPYIPQPVRIGRPVRR
jgi:hypothetical protein